jgi:hypothetical protein
MHISCTLHVYFSYIGARTLVANNANILYQTVVTMPYNAPTFPLYICALDIFASPGVS